MTQPGNVMRDVADYVARDQRDQVFLATAVGVDGQNVTIRRAGASEDEGPYVAISEVTVSESDTVVVARVGDRKSVV